MLAMSCSPLACMARAARSLSGVHTVGRPPVRPRARAAASPACVRSRMRSRSNSARAPKTWKISRPPGVEVSIASVRLRKATFRSFKARTVSMRWPQGSAEPVQSPDDDGVPRTDLVQQCIEARASVELAGGLVGEDPCASGLAEGVVLQVLVLVEGRDAGVAEQVAVRLTTQGRTSF